jgi:hypothetical protein
MPSLKEKMMDIHFNKLIGSAIALWAIGASADVPIEPSVAGSAPPPSPAVQIPWEQGRGFSENQYPAGFNAAARIEPQKGCDLWMSGSWLYWWASQDAMQLAVNTSWDAVNGYRSPSDGSFISPDFSFHPGFKVGLGIDFNYDHWIANLEYTWFHQSTTTHLGAPEASSGTALWRANWFSYQNITAAFSFFEYGTDLQSKWRANLDMVDGTLSRPFYLGRILTIHPFGGLRFASLRQNFRLALNGVTGTPPAPVFWNPLVSHNHSNNWAIGPRFGLDGHCLLGKGFYIQGEASGSILYARYTDVSHRENTPFANVTTATRYHRFNTVRSMADLQIGAGWGTYFRQRFHVDFLAAYDFNILWQQNMMHQLVDTSFTGTPESAGDLYLQGLNITARLDF